MPELEEGFTPLFDVITTKHGRTVSLVFGVVHRYCQMADRECWATQAKIAKRAGISTRTVQAVLETLVKNGYLRVVGRKKTGRWFTNRYVLTGKVGFGPIGRGHNHSEEFQERLRRQKLVEEKGGLVSWAWKIMQAGYQEAEIKLFRDSCRQMLPAEKAPTPQQILHQAARHAASTGLTYFLRCTGMEPQAYLDSLKD
jgi:Helix-turn-helix domain